MKFSPNFEIVRQIADSSRYNILPVSCEILSDICTSIEALQILKNVSSHCYLLESVSEKEKWGRYTFLGFDPKLEIPSPLRAHAPEGKRNRKTKRSKQNSSPMKRSLPSTICWWI